MTESEIILGAFALLFLGCFVVAWIGWAGARRKARWGEEQTRHWYENYHLAAERLANLERAVRTRIEFQVDDQITPALRQVQSRLRSFTMFADPQGWSEWVHPWPGYQMECCDCGLIHLLEFQIVLREWEDDEPLNEGESDEQVIIFRAKRGNHADRP